MNTYMVLSTLTDKALSTIEETSERFNRFEEIAKELDVNIISNHLLLGRYDMVTLLEAPNSETVAKLCLIIGKRGNVRTQTFPAFSENTFKKITDSLK